MDHQNKLFGMNAANSAHDNLTGKLLEGVDSQNVRHTCGSCEIKLWPAWAQMLDTIPALGEVVIITGNPCVTLGVTRFFPPLEFCENFCHASAPDGSLTYEFVPWGGGLVVSCHRGQKRAHFLEFRDCADVVIHKICLTEKSNTERFIEWVHYHQASRMDQPPAYPFSPARWRTIQQRHWFDYEMADYVSPSSPHRVLEAALRRQMEVCVMVGNEGTAQSACFAPRSVVPVENWTFYSDDKTGIHLNAASITHALVYHGPGARSVTARCSA